MLQSRLYDQGGRSTLNVTVSASTQTLIPGEDTPILGHGREVPL